jgi:hypothetical protein
VKKLVLAATLLVVAGCSPGLRVDTYPTQPRTDVECKALFADAPQEVAGQDSILVEGDNAAPDHRALRGREAGRPDEDVGVLPRR